MNNNDNINNNNRHKHICSAGYLNQVKTKPHFYPKVGLRLSPKES